MPSTRRSGASSGRRLGASTRPSRVAVVGAGPAGLEAACRAAEAGHEVVLLERCVHTGGALAVAARSPTLRRLERLVGWFDRRLAAAGVDLRTETMATAPIVAALAPELVVVAVGSVTDPPVLDGYDLLPAWTIEDMLCGRASTLGGRLAPTRPVVIGAGRPALAGALACAATGADVALLCRERPGFDASGLIRRAYLARLEREGVRRVRGRPLALTADGVRFVDDDGDEGFVGGDGVVIADRRGPVALAGLDDLEAQVVVVGDARAPRDIASAIAEGREAVDAFTRTG